MGVGGTKKVKPFYLIKLYDGSCWGQVTEKWNMLYILLARSAAKRFSHKEKKKRKKIIQTKIYLTVLADRHPRLCPVAKL